MLTRFHYLPFCLLMVCAGCASPVAGPDGTMANGGAAGPGGAAISQGTAASGDPAASTRESGEDSTGGGGGSGEGEGPSSDNAAAPNANSGKRGMVMYAKGGISGGVVAPGPDPEFQAGFVTSGTQTPVCNLPGGKYNVHLRGKISYAPKPIIGEPHEVLTECSQVAHLPDLETPDWLSVIRVIYAKSTHETSYQDFYLLSSLPSGQAPSLHQVRQMMAVNKKPLVYFDMDIVTAAPESVRFLLGSTPSGEHLCTAAECNFGRYKPNVCNGLDVTVPDDVPSCPP